MAVVIFILILLAIYHFVYESIIAPTLRIKIRYKLFETRDKLRKIKLSKDNTVSEEVFKYVDYSINSTIMHLPFYSISLLYRAIKEFRSNEKLKKQVEERIELIESCKNEEVLEIFNKANKYSSYAFLANMGAWMLYLSPFILILLLISGFKKNVITPLKRYSERISFAPEMNFQFYSEGDDLYPNFG